MKIIYEREPQRKIMIIKQRLERTSETKAIVKG